jgi:hypothetical protein
LRLLILLVLLMLASRLVPPTAATSLSSSSSAEPEFVSPAVLPWLAVGDRVAAVSWSVGHVHRLHRFAVGNARFGYWGWGFGHRSGIHHRLACFAFAVRIVVRRWF